MLCLDTWEQNTCDTVVHLFVLLEKKKLRLSSHLSCINVAAVGENIIHKTQTEKHTTDQLPNERTQ